MAQPKFVNQYTRLDRLLHRAAFASGGLQVSLADIEDRLYRKQLANIGIESPVFVTALPRAGTTILLNLLNRTGEFATHTYRSMPFVLSPVFWQRFSRSIGSRDIAEMERAHGDGIAISIDSPEAFEEIIWSQFWRSHYRDDHIRPWGRAEHPEFVSFLKSHIRKQLWLAGLGDEVRYLSKNNLNIARLGYIRTVFPDAIFLIPFRSPLQHAASLLRQHLKFLQSHTDDTFAMDYMRGIGHYDFGANFLPVNFSSWLDGDRRGDATELPFWLEYWIAAYRSILANMSDAIQLISFEYLTSESELCLHEIARSVNLRHDQSLIDQHKTLHEAQLHVIDGPSVSTELLSEANTLYEDLVAKSRNDRQTLSQENVTGRSSL